MQLPPKETSDSALEPPTPSRPPKPVPQGPMALSISGLLAGVVALALAVIPAIAFERALPNPFMAPPKADRRVEAPMEREGGVTFKFKKLSINIGGKAPKAEQPMAELPAVTKDPLRWFLVTAIGFALVGLFTATIGHLRERHTVLTVSSIGCCVAAITWQYIAIGLAVGAAIAALLIVLAILGSTVGS